MPLAYSIFLAWTVENPPIANCEIGLLSSESSNIVAGRLAGNLVILLEDKKSLAKN